MSFGPRFSEICAHFGSEDCLQYLIETGHELSQRLNLYRMRRGDEIVPLVSCSEELYYVLCHERDHLLPLPEGQDDEALIRISRPSPRTALLTLIRLLENNAFDMIDYATKVRALYDVRERAVWSGQLSTRVIQKVIEHGLYDFLCPRGLSIVAFMRLTKRERKDLSQHCPCFWRPKLHGLRRR